MVSEAHSENIENSGVLRDAMIDAQTTNWEIVGVVVRATTGARPTAGS